MGDKVTWNQLHEYSQKELRDGHGLGIDKQSNAKLENEVRRHLDGANATERRDFYNSFYGRRR
jgi:hypothetical protein